MQQHTSVCVGCMTAVCASQSALGIPKKTCSPERNRSSLGSEAATPARITTDRQSSSFPEVSKMSGKKKCYALIVGQQKSTRAKKDREGARSSVSVFVFVRICAPSICCLNLYAYPCFFHIVGNCCKILSAQYSPFLAGSTRADSWDFSSTPQFQCKRFATRTFSFHDLNAPAVY